MNPRDLLASLRDVEGVYGCLVVSPTGAVVARDVPSWMEGASVEEAGGRIARLRDTLAPDGPLDWCAVRFAQHKLFLRAVGELVYSVIARADIDATALRMAMTLTARRFPTFAGVPAPSFEERPATAPPPSVRPPSVPPPPMPPPLEPPPSEARASRPSAPPFGGGARPRTYRGRRIDES